MPRIATPSPNVPGKRPLEAGARLDLDVATPENMLSGRWYCHAKGSDYSASWDTRSELVLKPDGRFESSFHDHSEEFDDEGYDGYGITQDDYQYHKGLWHVEPSSPP